MPTKKITIFKVFIVALVSVVCMHVFTVYVNSALYYNETCRISCSGKFLEDNITVFVSLYGNDEVDSIDNCSITITDSGNKLVKSWTGLSSKSSLLSVAKTTSGVAKGETYTVTVTATVHFGSSSEIVTKSFTKKYE